MERALEAGSRGGRDGGLGTRGQRAGAAHAVRSVWPTSNEGDRFQGELESLASDWGWKSDSAKQTGC